MVSNFLAYKTQLYAESTFVAYFIVYTKKYP